MNPISILTESIKDGMPDVNTNRRHKKALREFGNLLQHAGGQARFVAQFRAELAKALQLIVAGKADEAAYYLHEFLAGNGHCSYCDYNSDY